MISAEKLLEARHRIKNRVLCTPVLSNDYINHHTGTELFFKCENLQTSGSFKPRGAFNSILQLDENQMKYGVCTHSSGNHGQAVALVAAKLGIPSVIVMPKNAVDVKVQGVKNAGGRIVFCENTVEDRERVLAQIKSDTGATYIPPYDHPHTIAGQSTVAQEFFEQIAGLQMLVVPVGGGGLLSGNALAAYYLGNKMPVYGAEPLGADDAYRSFKTGHHITTHQPQTIADGLRTTLGNLPFEIIRTHVTDIITASEAQILEAIKWIWQHLHVVVEPSGALGLAAVMAQAEVFAGKRVGVILSGGNLDIAKHFDGVFR